jgi:undecaprenyl-diphosphatase
MLEYLTQLDIKWFLFLNGQHSPFWDTVMWYVSGTKTWIPLYVLILFFVFKKMKWQGFIALLFFALLIFFADQGSVKLFKNVFERLRPCHNPEIQHLVHTVNGKCGGQFGFVSSHAANTFALAMFSSLFFRKRWISISFFVWAAVISYSRIYLGVHFPFDVICGGLLGMLIGILTFLFFNATLHYIQKRKSREKPTLN